MRINCIIVEDEPLAMERTKSFVEKLPFLHLLSGFDNAIDALVFLNKQPVDLIFLDIHMDELSGIGLLSSSKINSEVIITTAYDEYALKGFELNVTDYLLKPFSFERFIQAVEKVQAKLLKNEPVNDKNYVFVKTEYRLEKLFLSDILYIEGMRDYRKIVAVNRNIMTLQTFREFEQEITASILCRVHKSYMVSLEKIDSIERDRIRIKNMIIPVSGTYKKAFFSLINHPEK